MNISNDSFEMNYPESAILIYEAAGEKFSLRTSLKRFLKKVNFLLFTEQKSCG